MTRLLVHVEGQTEETFVNEVLAPHLYSHGFTLVSARIFGNARQRDRRGGVKPWETVRRDIARHLVGDRGCIATLMVDYYGMPTAANRFWPGREESGELPIDQRAPHIENKIQNDILAELGADFDASRFVPFILMHEFEALLFSDCVAFADAIALPDVAPAMQLIRNQFATPEEIDDSPQTAPSKRIEGLVRSYQKPLHGNIGALAIGLEKMREECPHFDNWITRLERYGADKLGVAAP